MTLTNERFGQYQLNNCLGTGSLGTVYQAEDVNLQRQAAVKLIDIAISQESEMRQQIMKAAQLDSKLAHPAIVPLYDFAHEGEQLYVAMGYVDGVSLKTIFKVLSAWQKRLRLAEILQLMAQVADTLGHAHQEGVWHLNLHPGNILLRQSQRPQRGGNASLCLLLTDFGMTPIPSGGVQTAVSDVSLMLPYLSPEQCLGHRVDGRSDMYSFGIILYEMITGRHPFEITSITEAITAHSLEVAEPLHTFRDDIPRELERLMQMLLAKKATERVQRAEQLADVLRTIANGILTDDSSPDVIQLTDYFAEIMMTEKTMILNEKTPVRPHRLGSAPQIVPQKTTKHNGNGNGHVLTAVPKPDDTQPMNKTTLTVPAPGSMLLSNMPTEISHIAPTNEYLFITRRGRVPERIHLQKTALTVGRASKNELVLESLDVSRLHVRLTQNKEGWEIEDLGSRAGTFMNGRRLKAHQPTAWQNADRVQIGAYFLSWQAIEREVEAEQLTNIHTIAEPETELFQLPQGGHEVQSAQGQFSAALYPALVTISPSDDAVMQIELFNQAWGVDVYSLSVMGLPAGLAELAQTSVSVAPGARVSLPLKFQLPAEGTPQMRAVQAGKFPFQLLIASQTNSEETAVLNGMLLVGSVEAFTSSIWPHQMPNPGTCRILIRNDGNIPSHYSLIGRDENKQLRFTGQEGRVFLQPGEAVTKKLKVVYGKRPFFGERYAYPFEIEVRTNDGLVKTCHAAIRIEPQMPKWVVPVAQFAFVVLLILLVVGAVANYQFSRGSGVVEGNGGNTAVTAPATIMDTDEDGLSDDQETTIGTDPHNPDSDYDGLSDGNELHNLTLNPLHIDTDEDGLPDGAEVNIYRTNPTQPDTDNDGINDMDEVQQQSDPLHP